MCRSFYMIQVRKNQTSIIHSIFIWRYLFFKTVCVQWCNEPFFISYSKKNLPLTWTVLGNRLYCTCVYCYTGFTELQLKKTDTREREKIEHEDCHGKIGLVKNQSDRPYKMTQWHKIFGPGIKKLVHYSLLMTTLFNTFNISRCWWRTRSLKKLTHILRQEGTTESRKRVIKKKSKGSLLKMESCTVCRGKIRFDVTFLIFFKFINPCV